MNGSQQERYQEARAVYASADRLLDEQTVAGCYDRMAGDIAAEMATLDPVMLCVMLGGLHATAELTKRLEFAFEQDYLHATRYRGETDGGELVWKVSPGLRLAGRHVLIIDDILDEGHTLAAIIEAINNQGVASLRSAVLVAKDHDRRVPGLQPDFVGARVEDRYVFGAGMDYKGYYRQLPAVYAVGHDFHPKYA